MKPKHIEVTKVVAMLAALVGAYESHRQAADALGFDNGDLSKVLRGLKLPTKGMCAALGVVPHTIYLFRRK